MKRIGMKWIVMAAVASFCVAAPSSSFAQRYDRDDHMRVRDSLKDEVNRVERESNSFRFYFEHNFRDNGHGRKWDPYDRYGTPEHQGRNGRMSLKDSIQNLDEDFERLRTVVNLWGRTPRARDLMNEIMEHSRDVDVRIARTAEAYSFRNERDWRYDRSELFSRWNDLRRDTLELDRRFGRR